MFKFAVDMKHPDKYHIINEEKIGTECNMPLNQDLQYLMFQPLKLPICEECKESQEKRKDIL